MTIIFVVSCKTIPAYKIVMEIMPQYPDNPICYYRKLSDIQKKKVRCYKADAKNKDGSYRFKNTLVISKRAFREILVKQIDGIFK